METLYFNIPFSLSNFYKYTNLHLIKGWYTGLYKLYIYNSLNKLLVNDSVLLRVQAGADMII